MSEKKETKSDAAAENKLIHAGQEVGKVIARSTFQAEQTGKKIKKKVEETVSRLGSSKNNKETKTVKSPFTDQGEFALVDRMGFVAGEIFEHLSQHGEMATEKLVKAIMGRKNSNAMVFCAIGWLAREGKINLSADGALISLKPL
ncbi:MAG: winged helix-turn-helix domain-containing protein [Desulfobulbaceae bacterium]|nr:winged helix-turn-helix domain-containing protein [Desulfobulbaceae bacterium]